MQVGRHQHIIMVVDYFIKLDEAISTVKSDGKTATFFVFNQIIARFGIPSEIVTDHGSHFQNEMMEELAAKLGFKHGHYSPYYPQENGQVEVVNKSLKTILQKTVSQSKSTSTSCYILHSGHIEPRSRLPPNFPLSS
jgi:transposase InsO family protein